MAPSSPTDRATMAAVAGASPVTITVRTPNACSSLTRAAESARGGSLSAMRPTNFIASRRSGRDRQHAKALPLELLGARLRGRRRSLRRRDHHGVGALHHALRLAARIHQRVASDIFCGRVERRECGQLRRIGAALAQGGRPDGAIDRVLPALRTGQRRQRQNMRFVETGHRANLRHAQSVLRQGAGLVGAQDIHRRRFIHRGEPRRKDAELGELARARAPPRG